MDASQFKNDPLVGATIAGKFLVQEPIGQGSMGVIYKAEHVTLKRTVALKVIRQQLVGDDEHVQRFHREAQAASRLRHPNCVQIIDCGQTDDGVLYIAMEFIAGVTLRQLLLKEHPLSLDRVVNIAKQIALALDEAHSQGVLHRDLKPDNVMVEDLRNMKDVVRVVDFGIAKLQDQNPGAANRFQTRTGMVCGTPEFMSPEHIQGQATDARSDLYGIGCLLYALLCGKVPFTGGSHFEVAMLQVEAKRPPVEGHDAKIAAIFDPLLDALMAKDPDHRPASAMDVHAELERITRDIAILQHRPLEQSIAPDATAIDMRALEDTPPPTSGKSSSQWEISTIQTKLDQGLVESLQDRTTGPIQAPQTTDLAVGGFEPASARRWSRVLLVMTAIALCGGLGWWLARLALQ